MIIGDCRLNKLYFMQYYTESNINAETPDLTINLHHINTLTRQHCFIENVDHVPDYESGFLLSTQGIFSQNFRARKSYTPPPPGWMMHSMHAAGDASADDHAACVGCLDSFRHLGPPRTPPWRCSWTPCCSADGFSTAAPPKRHI
jgi:hypothetical protein